MEGPVIARHPRAPSTNGAAQTSVMYLARTTGITNVPPSLSLSRTKFVRSISHAVVDYLDRSIDRFSAFTKAILTPAQHKRIIDAFVHTRARIMEQRSCARLWTRVMRRRCWAYCRCCVFDGIFGEGEGFAVTRGACRRGGPGGGRDDKDGEGKRGRRMFARK